MSSSLSLNALFSLRGRIALVTGGGTGIGWMISQGLAESGAKVYITGRRADVLETKAKQWNDENKEGSIVPLQMDVTDKDSILKGREIVERNDGRLHILVNNAGQGGPKSDFFNDLSHPAHASPQTLGLALFQHESFSEWADLYAINTFAIYFCTTAFLGLLATGSSDVENWTSVVVNVTSISGINKLAQRHFAYNSSKAAASHLTKMLATELALKNVPVRVCAVAPGVYESEMTHATIGPELVDKVGLGITPVPAKRPGNAQEIAGTVIYLASPSGCYTNGQEIVVDGGYTAVNPSTA